MKQDVMKGFVDHPRPKEMKNVLVRRGQVNRVDLIHFIHPCILARSHFLECRTQTIDLSIVENTWSSQESFSWYDETSSMEIMQALPIRFVSERREEIPHHPVHLFVVDSLASHDSSLFHVVGIF